MELIKIEFLKRSAENNAADILTNQLIQDVFQISWVARVNQITIVRTTLTHDGVRGASVKLAN